MLRIVRANEYSELYYCITIYDAAKVHGGVVTLAYNVYRVAAGLHPFERHNFISFNNPRKVILKSTN